MHAPNTTLRDFYQSELNALREEALAFADQHQDIARILGLNAQAATDPQVELLMQSFAYLTGKLQYQREVDQATLPNALLGFLYPHLEAPMPAMLVAEIAVQPDGANFAKEQVLKRERYVGAQASNGDGHKIECRFRTCYDTPLLPLHVQDIRIVAASRYEYPTAYPRVHSVLQVRLKLDSPGKFQTEGPQRLRFFINTSEPNAFRLYESLALHLNGIAVHVPASETNPQSIAFTPCDAMHWLGFADDEAILESNPHTHPGYRLLQEYFTFPEKFMFFEVAQLDLINVKDGFDLLFMFDTPQDKSLTFAAQALRLNCVPLVNLFPLRIDPLALDHSEYEYRLLADLENHRYCEIYSLQSLESIRSDGSPRPIAPYFAMDDAERLEKQDYFYVARREASKAVGVDGTDLFVSFLDLHFNMTQLVDEVIGGKALCTNRRLPEQLRPGEKLTLEGAGPVKQIIAITKPTPHQTPDLIGTRPWALVSQLALNHLSLTDGPHALTALKDILRLHVGANRIGGMKQIDGLVNMRTSSVMHPRLEDGWRGFVRGIRVHLEMNRDDFKGGSPILLCEVLSHFFALYATVNNLVDVDLEMQETKGVLKSWRAQAGAQIVL